MTVSVGLGGSKPDARPHKFICICLAWDALTVETAHIFTISTPQQSLRDEIALTVYNTEFWKWSKYRPNVFSVVLNCQLQSLVVGPVPQREGHGCMQDHSSRQTDTEFPPNWASAIKKSRQKGLLQDKKWFVVPNICMCFLRWLLHSILWLHMGSAWGPTGGHWFPAAGSSKWSSRLKECSWPRIAMCCRELQCIGCSVGCCIKAIG